MAVYKFRCEKCAHEFDAKQSMEQHANHKDDPKCPKCGEANVRHLISPVNIKTSRKS